MQSVRLSITSGRGRVKVQKNGTGVALIEILVVLAIVGTLIALSMPAMQKAWHAAEDTSIRNELMQIGIAYCNYAAANELGPKTQQQLSPFYENSSRINDAINNEQITVIWGLSANDLGPAVLAYETHADRIGNRIAAMGDGSVQTLSGPEFTSALKR